MDCVKCCSKWESLAPEIFDCVCRNPTTILVIYIYICSTCVHLIHELCVPFVEFVSGLAGPETPKGITMRFIWTWKACMQNPQFRVFVRNPENRKKYKSSIYIYIYMDPYFFRFFGFVVHFAFNDCLCFYSLHCDLCCGWLIRFVAGICMHIYIYTHIACRHLRFIGTRNTEKNHQAVYKFVRLVQTSENRKEWQVYVVFFLGTGKRGCRIPTVYRNPGNTKRTLYT